MLLPFYLVPKTHRPDIPSPPRIRQVKHPGKIQVEIGFADDPIITVIVNLPQVAVVVFGQGSPFHADGFNRCDFAEHCEVAFKTLDGSFVITFAVAEVVVMIANLVTECGYFLDDVALQFAVEDAKVVCASDAFGVLQAGYSQGISGSFFHIVAQDDSFISWMLQELSKGQESIILILKGLQKAMVCFEVKVQ